MAIKIVEDGTEAEILPVMGYLERQYGIPAEHIRSITVNAEVGQPLAITVTVYVQEEEEEPTPAPSRGNRLSPVAGDVITGEHLTPLQRTRAESGSMTDITFWVDRCRHCGTRSVRGSDSWVDRCRHCGTRSVRGSDRAAGPDEPAKQVESDDPLGLTREQRQASDIHEAIDSLQDPATFARKRLGLWTSDAWQKP